MVTSSTSILAGAFGASAGNYGVDGAASGSEVVRVPPDREVVLASGSWIGIGPMNLQVLAHGVNSQREQFTGAVVEAMLEDDAVGPAFETLKLGALSGELGIHPSVEPDSQEATDEGADPDEARRAAEFCRRSHARLAVPIPVWGKDALNALAFGHKLAEMVVVEAKDGPDRGLYVLDSLDIKPIWSYHLATDPFRNLIAAWCQTAQGSQYVDIGHFVVFSWDVRDKDPRGSSLFRAAKDPWRRKLRSKESRSKGDDQFGTPNLAFEMPPGTPLETRDPDTGLPAPSSEVNKKKLQTMQSGGAFVHGAGGKIYVVESSREGTQIATSIDSYDRAITRAILLQAKATMEAKHYTQGGGEIGQDLITAFSAHVQAWFLSVVRRQVFWRLLAMNRDPAYADLYTPRLTIGQRLDDKLIALATALSVMGQAGLLAPSQIAQMLSSVGIKPPLPGELRIGPSGPITDKPPPDPAEVARAAATAIGSGTDAAPADGGGP